MGNRFQSTVVSTICYHAYTAAYAAHAIVQCLHGVSNWLDVNWKIDNS